MRKLLVLGTIGAAFALGAGAAYALPANSPYAIWEPQSVDPGWAPAGEPAINEGRSAFVEGSPGYDSFAPSIATPEDRTYYSRGK